MQWTVIIQIFFATVAGLILLGGAVLLVRGSYNKAKLIALDEDNDRLRKRITDIEAIMNAKDDELKIRDAKIERCEIEQIGLQAELDLLRALVTQRAEVEEVIDLLKEHDKNVILGLQQVVQEIKNGRGNAGPPLDGR